MKTLKIITIALITFILIHPLSIGKTTGVSANFTYSPTNPVVNQPVNFTSSGVNVTSWEWDFGDDTLNVYNVTMPTHVYIESRYYTVTLTVADQESRGIPVSVRLFVRKINTSLLLDPPEFSSGGNEVTLTATLSDEYGEARAAARCTACRSPPRTSWTRPTCPPSTARPSTKAIVPKRTPRAWR